MAQGNPEISSNDKLHVSMLARLSDLDAGSPSDREDMLQWVRINYENFVRLPYPDKQYFPAICRIFVSKRLELTDNLSSVTRFSLSLKKFPCVKLDYVTARNEEIEYYDKELEIVTYLESAFSLTFRIEDSQSLLRKLDIAASSLNMGTVYETFRSIALESWCEVIAGLVDESGVGYYHFAANYSKISAKMESVLNAKLLPYGTVATGIKIERMSIPPAVREMLRQNSYDRRTETERFRIDNEYADMYLEQYRKKAEIKSKYGIEESLTELEKDKALERYLKRLNNERRSGIEETNLMDREDSYADMMPVKPVKPSMVRPDPPAHATSYSLSIIMIIAAAVALIAGIVLAILKLIPPVGAYVLIGAGALFLVVGVALMIVLRHKFANKYNAELEKYKRVCKIYDEAHLQYEKDLRKYEIALAEYLKKHPEALPPDDYNKVVKAVAMQEVATVAPAPAPAAAEEEPAAE